MNQIFKVVYSAAKQCYVVTSEFAKSNGKKAAVVAAAFGINKCSRCGECGG